MFLPPKNLFQRELKMNNSRTFIQIHSSIINLFLLKFLVKTSFKLSPILLLKENVDDFKR